MLTIFLFALFSYEIIPPELRELADEALANSLIKIPKELRQRTEHPGDFSFPDLRFTLKKTLACPMSRDIKGYAIKDNKIAIVKRKAFNIEGEFAFVDPPTQDIYQLGKIIASDDKVNIYETNPLTIFDIMTNFHYHAKSARKISPSVDINWDRVADEPKTKPVGKLGGFELGLGASGKLSLDIDFDFKTKLDCTIRGNAEIDVKVGLLAKFFDKTQGDSDEEIELFEMPPFKINDLSQQYNFLFIKFSVETFIKSTLAVENIRISVPNSIDYFKGYRFVGFKYIEISSFNVVDSEWLLVPYHLQERNSIKKVLDELSSASFSMTPNVKVYFSIEIELAGLHTQLDFGLKFPFQMTFGFNSDKCLLPYLYGNIVIGINMFYNFDGIKYRIFKKDIKLIGESDGELEVLEFEIPSFCIGEPSQVVEGSPAVLQRNYSTSYFVENGGFYWDKNNENDVRLVFDGLVNGVVAATRSVPYMAYSTDASRPTKVNSHFIITTNTKPTLKWYYVKNVKQTYKKKLGFMVYQYYYYYEDVYSTSDLYTVKNDENLIRQDFSTRMIRDGSHILIGNAVIWTCREIKINKVFKRPKGAVVVTNIPCKAGAEYVIVALNQDGSTKIDDKAKFYAESMTTDDLSFEGIYKADFDHYEVKYYKFMPEKAMEASIRLTLQTSRNGVNKNESFGGFSAKFSSAGTFTAEQVGVGIQNMKFYAKPENYPVIYHDTDMLFRTSGEKEDKQLMFIGTLDTDTINDFASRNVNCIMSYQDVSTQFELNIKYLKSPLVSIKSGLSDTPDEEILTTLYRHNIKSYDATFSIKFEKDEVYKVIRFDAASNIPLSKCYIIIKSDKLTPLMGNMVRIANDIYCIKCDSNIVNVPIRRQSPNAETVQIRYIISDLNNPNDVNMASIGEAVAFTSTSQPKAFVAIKINGKFDFFYSSTAKLTYYTMDVDENHQLVAILSNKAETIIFVNTHTYLEERKINVTYETSHIERLIQSNPNAKMPIKIICKSTMVGAIRCGNIVSQLVNGVATFELPPSPNHQYVFYAVCKDSTGVMCELTFTPNEGEYQLINLKNKDGLNITGRGMETAIIHAPKGQSIGYYKSYSDSIQVIRSYSSSIKIKLTINDQFPSVKMLDSVYDRDLEGATRDFCIFDENGEKIPFSTKFLQDGLETFIKSAGFNQSEVVDYTVVDDNCLSFELKDFEKNVFVTFPPNAVDLEVQGDMEVDSEGVQYDPEYIPPSSTPKPSRTPPPSGFVDEEIEISVTTDINSTDEIDIDDDNNKDKGKFKLTKKMIFIIACAAAGVIIVVIIIVVVVVVVHKRKKVYSSDPELEMVNYDTQEKVIDDVEQVPEKKTKNKKKDNKEEKEDNSYNVSLFG